MTSNLRHTRPAPVRDASRAQRDGERRFAIDATKLLLAALTLLPAAAQAHDDNTGRPPLAAAAAREARDAILADTRRVADWQLANMTYYANMPQPSPGLENVYDWQQATFWLGLTELADRDAKYAAPILDAGRSERWRLGPSPYFADDQLIAQVWAWAAAHGAGPQALNPARTYFDRILAKPSDVALAFVERGAGALPLCIDRWCWCDALFMAPPTILKVGQALRDPRYARFVHREYKATANYLFDPQERLFFRDSRFFDQRNAAGDKIFWSRGNGWVLAGLVRILSTLEARDPHRRYYEDLFKTLAGRIVTLQKPDGYWPASLLDRAATPPETSGTAFFVYAFAWGVRTGLLTDPAYARSADRGWAALVRAVRSDGMLGWVQQASNRPESVSKDQTQFFGSGAYLLAGTAMADLAASSRGPTR